MHADSVESPVVSGSVVERAPLLLLVEVVPDEVGGEHVRGTRIPTGAIRLGRLGVAVNALAVAWLAFEVVNIAWPRESLAPPGAPVYQVWAAPIVLAAIALGGLAYLVVARPHRRVH